MAVKLSEGLKGKMGVEKPTPKPTEYAGHLGEVIKSTPAKGTVTVIKQGSSSPEMTTKDEEFQINKGVLSSLTELVKIEVAGSHTVNLGNYESAKISVGIIMPCTMLDLEEAYSFASDWVSEKIQEAVAEVKE